MKGKIKITSKMVKKSLLYALLVFLLGLFTVVVVESYGSGHIYSYSSIPDSVTPLGEYKLHLDEYKNAKTPENVKIKALGVDAVETTFKSEEYSGELGLLTESVGSAKWEFDIPTAGFYNILVDYLPVVDNTSGGANIERKFLVNDEIPFDDLRNII